MIASAASSLAHLWIYGKACTRQFDLGFYCPRTFRIEAALAAYLLSLLF